MLRDVRARVSDRRLLHAVLVSLGVSDEQAPAVFAVIDKLDRQPKDISREKTSATTQPGRSRAQREGTGEAKQQRSRTPKTHPTRSPSAARKDRKGPAQGMDER